MSDLEKVTQSLQELLSNTQLSIIQVRETVVQVKSLVDLAIRTLDGSQQRDYQDLINRLVISQKQAEISEKLLIQIINSGNNWTKEHVNYTQSVSDSSDLSNIILSTFPHDNGFDSLKPSRTTPRDLLSTQYVFSKTSSGMEVYDSPLEVDKYLYSNQGSAYDNFKGTCGLCSCANILRLSGVDVGEKEIIDYAANINGGFFSPKLCTVNPLNPSASGGTTPKQRQQILDAFGISSSVCTVKTDPNGKVSLDTINDIATWISEGRGVIIDIDAGLFYNSPRNYGKGHAVTITSVEKNKYGDIAAFYILDSNQGTVKCNACDVQDMIRSFVGINVTNQIIR